MGIGHHQISQAHHVTSELVIELRVSHGNVGHISWTTEDLEAEMSFVPETGCPLLITSRTGARADWFEGGPVFGHPIEIHQPTTGVLDVWRVAKAAQTTANLLATCSSVHSLSLDRTSTSVRRRRLRRVPAEPTVPSPAARG